MPHAFPSLSRSVSSHTPCSGYVPIPEHAHRLQNRMQTLHFFPSRYMEYNPIFHKSGSLRSKGLRTLFQAVFSGKSDLCRCSHQKKSGSSSYPRRSHLTIPVPLTKTDKTRRFLLFSSCRLNEPELSHSIWS